MEASPICRFVLALVGGFVLALSPASAFDRLWIKSFDNDGTTGDTIRKIVQLPDGDLIGTGKVGSTTTGDIRVVRLNSDGSTQWSRVFDVGGTSDDVNDMHVDTATEEIYLCGRVTVSGQALNWWVMKLNGSDGSNAWSAPYTYNQNNANDEPRALTLVQDGAVKNVVVVGQIDISGTQGRIVKLNGATGASMWGANISSGQMWDVVTDSNGNIYAGGETFFTPNAYLVKYNVSGTQQWYKTYAPHGGSFNRWNHLALDPSSNDIITCGLITGASSNNDLGISRYNDTDGSQVWTKLINGPGNDSDQGSNVIVDNGGDAYVTGFYKRAATHPGTNAYIARINIANGNIVWEKDYTGDTGTTGDQLENIQIVGSTLYAAGYLTNTTPGRSTLVLKLNKADGAEIEKTIFTDRVSPQFVGKQAMVIASNGDIIVAGDSGVTTGTGEVHRYGVAAPVATVPTVTTTAQSSVTHNSATLGGNVTADGGATVTERGIVWGTSANPTTSNNKVSNGSGTGSFSATVTGLPSSTTVNVRAYAINSAGTAYGSNISFATSAAPAPEIALEQPAGTDIADGGSKGFGSVNYGSNTSLTFTIKNTGNADLTGLTITKDGTHSSEFTVTASPTAPVSGPSGTTTFTVQFAPAGGGARTAALHIASNDADENPFDINLSGTGVLSSNADLSNLVLSAGSLSPSFASGTISYSALVSNGTTSLTVTPTAAQGNATITVNGSSVASGSASGAISLNVGANTITTVVTAHDGTTTKTYTTTVTRAAPAAPEIAVEQPVGTGLTDGSASISFGSQAVGSTGSPLTFTVRNTGTADLTLSGISKNGTNGLDFDVSGLGSTTVAAGGSTTFTVTFSPISSGSRSAAIHIASNDADENPFDITLTGTGTVSNDANLSSLALSTGTLAPSFASGTTSYAASVAHSVSSLTLTATVAQANASLTINGSAAISGNPSGSLPLNVGANTLTTVVTAQDGTTTKTYTVVVTRAASNNANLSNLALSTGTLTPVFAAGTTSYTATVPNPVTSVTLTATVAQANASLTINGSAAISGNPSGSLSLNVGANTLTTVVTAQDGTTTKTYTVVVTRDPPSPQEIAIEQPSGTGLTDGSASVDFGDQTCTQTSAPLTFVIRNSGGADLTLGAFTKDGTNPTEFTVSAPGLTTIPPAGSTTFTVTFTPTAVGPRSAVLHIASNDSDENPFDIALAGSGVSAGVIDIDATATISVFEEAGTVDIPLVRTGSSTGAISVNLSTVNGTGKAPGDFTALTNYVVNFADGETSKNVPITIIADSVASEINEFFSVQLSAPAGGATLGSTTTASVRIVEPDLVIPTVSITAPGANANIAEGSARLTGTVTDAKGLARAEYSLNGGPWTPLPVTLNASGLTGTFSLAISPEIGANTVRVHGYDFRDNLSNDLSRSFTYVVLRPLTLTINPATGGTVTFTPALSAGKAQVGVSYTLKATAKPGYLWDSWTAPGVSGAAADAATLVITMTEGLAITADFVENTIMNGTYTGLATPQTGVTPNANNLGLFSGTLSTTGTFSGKINFGGTPYTFTAKFDPVTMQVSGSNANVSFDLELDSPTSKMTGTITLLSTGDICDVDADLAVFSAASPVPAQFLNAATTGTYTVVFAAKEQTPARDHHEYPQGDGVGKFTLYSAGTVSLSGTLADGTTITVSAPLSKDHRWPLAALVKASATVPGTTVGGWIQFDTSQNDSDLAATDLHWFRTALPTATSYSAGWTDGITVDAVGALYSSATNVQTTLQLGAADPSNGNGALEFTDGKLTSTITKTNFNLVVNTVTKLPATDPSFTLAPAAGTGTFSGSFAPNWSNPNPTKPTYRGTLLQKGANRGGYGFFISNAVGDTAAESGRVTLGPP